MNNKLLTMTLSLVAALALLVGTAYASVTQVSGYELYKDGLKNMKTIENMTADIAVKIVDNDKELGTFNANMKGDHQNELMSGSVLINVNNQEKYSEIYNSEDQHVIVANDEYYSIESNMEENHKQRLEDHEFSESAEKVVDALVGDIKNYFTVNEADNGVKEVSLALSEDQIPAVVNALVGLKSSHNDSEKPFEKDLEIKEAIFGDFESFMPELDSNVKITSFELAAKINQDSLIENQVLNVTVEGDDAEGVHHTIVVSIEMNFSDFNNTTSDTIDLTDKDVKIIEMNDNFKGHKQGFRN